VTVERFSIEGIAFEQVETQDGGAVRRTTLESLALDLSLTPGQAEPISLALTSPAETGTVLAIEELPGSREAQRNEMVFRLKSAVATPQENRIALAVGLDLVRQDFFALPISGSLLDVSGHLVFHPQDGWTRFELTKLDLVRGAAQTDLVVDLLDKPGGVIEPVIRRLRGKVDLDALRRAIPVAIEGVVLDGARVEYAIKNLALDMVTGTVLGGEVQITAGIDAVKLDSNGRQITISDVGWTLESRADEGGHMNLTSRLEVKAAGIQHNGLAADLGGIVLRTTGRQLSPDPGDPLESTGVVGLRLDIDDVRARLGDRQLTVSDIGLNVDATLEKDKPASIEVSLPVGSVALRSKGQRIELGGLSLSLGIDELHFDFSKPVRAKVSLGLSSADIRLAGNRIRLTDLGVELDAVARDPENFDIGLRLPVKQLTFRNRAGVTARLSGLRLGLDTENLELDMLAPVKSRGKLALTTRVGRIEARTGQIAVTGRGLGFDFNTHLQGEKPLQGVISLSLDEIAANRAKTGDNLLRIEKGRIDLALKNVVPNMKRPAASRAKVVMDAKLPSVSLLCDTSFSVPQLKLVLASSGAGKILQAEMNLALASFRIGQLRHATRLNARLGARVDLRRPAVDLDLAVKGPQGPDIIVKLATGYRSSERRLDYDVRVDLGNLAVLGKLLPEKIKRAHRLDWAALDIEIRGKGELGELIRGFAGGITPVIADKPIEVLRGTQTLGIDVKGLDYGSSSLSVRTPRFALTFRGSQQTGKVQADLGVQSDSIRIQAGDAILTLTDFAETLQITSDGSLEQGRINLALSTKIGRLDQNLVAGYPVADARLTVRGHMDRLASVRVEDIDLHNPAGGTRLRFSVAMDRARTTRAGRTVEKDAERIPGRKALALSGLFSQDLDKISVAEDTLKVRGKINLPFQLESGDLSTFRIAAKLKAHDLHIDLPGLGLTVAGLNCVIPLVEDIALLPDGGVKLLKGPEKNIYSRTRFLDTHPFLEGDNFLSVQRLSAMGLEFGPVAGNLRVKRDMFSLDQLQIGYRGGNISGQLVADYEEGSPRVFFKGNLTGIRPSQSDDVLDANATLTFVPDKLDLQGRIQVVRIGRDHLLDLLDFIDPYHENVNFNRARMGLKVGYPKFLRLRMQDGLLAVKIQLGGAAKVVRIDEIKNIALGPFLNRYLAPLMGKGEKP
jgi:translocation and assembly module TamB